MKRLISLFLVLSLVFSMCMVSFSEDESASQGLAYTDNVDSTCTITGIETCTDADMIIPGSINGLETAVTGNEAFKYRSPR